MLARQHNITQRLSGKSHFELLDALVEQIAFDFGYDNYSENRQNISFPHILSADIAVTEIKAILLNGISNFAQILINAFVILFWNGIYAAENAVRMANTEPKLRRAASAREAKELISRRLDEIIRPHTVKRPNSRPNTTATAILPKVNEAIAEANQCGESLPRIGLSALSKRIRKNLPVWTSE